MIRNKNKINRGRSFKNTRVYKNFGRRCPSDYVANNSPNNQTADYVLRTTDGSVLLIASNNALADVVTEQKKRFQDNNLRLLKRLQELKNVSG